MCECVFAEPCVCVFIKETEVQCIFICIIDLFLPPLLGLLSVESLTFSSGGNAEPRDLRSACMLPLQQHSRTLASDPRRHAQLHVWKEHVSI